MGSAGTLRWAGGAHGNPYRLCRSQGDATEIFVAPLCEGGVCSCSSYPFLSGPKRAEVFRCQGLMRC
jgi:hypothetical protein